MEGQLFLAQVMQLTVDAIANPSQNLQHIPLNTRYLTKSLASTKIDSSVERSPLPSLQAQVAEFFQKNGWLFNSVPQKTLLEMKYQGKHGEWQCFAQTIEPKKQFVFYSVCPEGVSEKKRGAIAELLTRINAGIILGNFELNYEIGEIRYKSSIEVDVKLVHDDLSTLIKRVAYTNVQMMDRHLPGIRAVLEGRKPKDALALT